MLTNDMKRLCGDIVALRKQRGEMLDAMAHECQDRQHSVAGICREFYNTRMEMARRTRHDRLAFLQHLRRTVQAHQRELRSDLAGVRRAWSGSAA